MSEEINLAKELVNQYGMPILAAGGMAYFIYFVWKFVTENVYAELAVTKKTMVSLIDRVRMLDNDLIRLEQKLNTALELQKRIKPTKKENLEE